MASDDIAIEIARTWRELERRAIEKIAAQQLGEAFEDISLPSAIETVC
jgi:hypothetical protein